MIFETDTIGDIVVARVGINTLDIQTATAFRRESETLISGRCVVLDLESVDFIDSTGLGALLSLLRALTLNGGDLRLSGVGAKVLSIFRLVRMNNVFEIHPNIDEAVASFLRSAARGDLASNMTDVPSRKHQAMGGRPEIIGEL